MLYNEHKTDLRLTNTKSYQYSVIICYSLSNKELPHYFYSNALSIKNKEDWLPLSFTHVIQKRFFVYKFFYYMCFILMSIWATRTINRTYTHISAYQRHNWFIWIFSTILHSSTCQASRFFSLSVYYTNVLKSTFCCDNVLHLYLLLTVSVYSIYLTIYRKYLHKSILLCQYSTFI